MPGDTAGACGEGGVSYWQYGGTAAGRCLLGGASPPLSPAPLIHVLRRESAQDQLGLGLQYKPRNTVRDVPYPP